MSFICHIHNYTEYNEEWNVFSVFNPSKSTHTLGAVGRWHCGARGAVGGSVPCSRVSPQSWTLPAGAGIRTHNLGLPWVSSTMLYPLCHDCPIVVSKEMSFQLFLEDWQGSSIPDRGGKIISPARNGERECSGEWYHEASLTSRSQTSGGDVDVEWKLEQVQTYWFGALSRFQVWGPNTIIIMRFYA